MRSKGRKYLLVTEYRDRVTAQILVHKMHAFILEFHGRENYSV